METKKIKQRVVLLVKEEITSPAEVSKKVEQVLEESKGVVRDELS